MLMFCLVLLGKITFQGSITQLSADEYTVRKAAVDRLIMRMPFSYPACRVAEVTTTNPEVATRCRQAIEAGWNRFRVSTPDAWDEVFQRLVDLPHDRDGLPWAPYWTHEMFRGSQHVDHAAKRYVERWRMSGRVPTYIVFWFEKPCDTEDIGRLYGLSDLRFAVRGLPFPSELMLPGYARPLNCHQKWDAVRISWWVRKNVFCDNR